MGLGFVADEVVAVILRIVDERPGFLIDPVIGDDAVPGRVGAGGQGGVAHGGFGIGVLVMGSRIPGAPFHQIAESPFRETIGIATGQVTAQLVDGDLQDQFRFFIGSGCAQHQPVQEKTAEQYQKQPFFFQCIPPFLRYPSNLVLIISTAD